MCAEPSPGSSDANVHWGVGGHASHRPGGTAPPGLDDQRAWWFFTGVKEQKSCTGSDWSPIQPHPWQPPQDAEKMGVGRGP